MNSKAMTELCPCRLPYTNGDDFFKVTACFISTENYGPKL